MHINSWGKYLNKSRVSHVLKNKQDLKKTLLEIRKFIPFGNGRSYGDSALGSNIIYCKKYNHFLNFNHKLGILHCQSGVLLKEIIETFVPRGWFLKITPGTKFVTVGGAIASDIHGKNHHIEGCFSNCLEEVTLMLPNGKITTCSRKKNRELFRSSCGGMGLTGIILDAKIKLKKINSKHINQTTIKSKNLKETFDLFEEYSSSHYSVAWIDCLAKNKGLGKGVLMIGEFANDGDLSLKENKRLTIPFYFPSFILNKYSIMIFNWIYYFKASSNKSFQKVEIDNFFYPLDKINNWNNIYGKKGFAQYQLILPKENSYRGLNEILEIISLSNKGSFLAVLKLHGKENKNYLSFPMEGYSLALDFKIENGLFEMFNKLDTVVMKYNGRLYLSKDVRVSKKTFEKGYPQIDKFRKFRKKNLMDLKFQSFQSKRVGI